MAPSRLALGRILCRAFSSVSTPSTSNTPSFKVGRLAVWTVGITCACKANAISQMYKRNTNEWDDSVVVYFIAELIQASDLIYDLAPEIERQPKPEDWNSLTFGHHYSDHMLTIEWSHEKGGLSGLHYWRKQQQYWIPGWERPVIRKLENLQLHPGSKVLHYAIELFEGMKAYRGVDNKIRIFRPELNMARMLKSAKRAALPVSELHVTYCEVAVTLYIQRIQTFSRSELLECIKELIRVEQEWVPYSTSSSLYIRPTMIGTDVILLCCNMHEITLASIPRN